MTIKDLVNASGLSQRAFSEHLNIPLRSVEDWCRGARQCPAYVISLIAYRLRTEGLISEAED